MTYELALSYLASLNESRIKPGLERIQEALLALGSPHLKFPHVLVGGTNGKGSVVSFMGAVLSVAGNRVGLFTSPHLQSFEERIVVDRQAVTREELPELVAAVRAAGVRMTYFEFATTMALLYFSTLGVDIAILEVGLGGQWDATNATDPMLSVITSVGMDHERWLGYTVEEIAKEKSGIMRKGRPVVVGPLSSAARDVVLRCAETVGAPVTLFGKDFCVRPESGGSGMEYNGLKWRIKRLIQGMKGLFQIENAASALAALEVLAAESFEISEDDAERGIRSARWPARFQEVEGVPPIIVDAAHNPAAVKALVESLGDGRKIVWLFSALAEKDVGGMTFEMSRLGKRFVLVPLDHPKARDVRDMAKDLPEGVDIKKVSSVRQGIEQARRLAGEEGRVVVAGSVVLAGAVLRELKKQGFDV